MGSDPVVFAGGLTITQVKGISVGRPGVLEAACGGSAHGG